MPGSFANAPLDDSERENQFATSNWSKFRKTYNNILLKIETWKTIY